MYAAVHGGKTHACVHANFALGNHLNVSRHLAVLGVCPSL